MFIWPYNPSAKTPLRRKARNHCGFQAAGECMTPNKKVNDIRSAASAFKSLGEASVNTEECDEWAAINQAAPKPNRYVFIWSDQ